VQEISNLGKEGILTSIWGNWTRTISPTYGSRAKVASLAGRRIGGG